MVFWKQLMCQLIKCLILTSSLQEERTLSRPQQVSYLEILTPDTRAAKTKPDKRPHQAFTPCTGKGGDRRVGSARTRSRVSGEGRRPGSAETPALNNRVKQPD